MCFLLMMLVVKSTGWIQRNVWLTSRSKKVKNGTLSWAKVTVSTMDHPLTEWHSLTLPRIAVRISFQQSKRAAKTNPRRDGILIMTIITARMTGTNLKAF